MLMQRGKSKQKGSKSQGSVGRTDDGGQRRTDGGLAMAEG